MNEKDCIKSRSERAKGYTRHNELIIIIIITVVDPTHIDIYFNVSAWKMTRILSAPQQRKCKNCCSAYFYISAHVLNNPSVETTFFLFTCWTQSFQRSGTKFISEWLKMKRRKRKELEYVLGVLSPALIHICVWLIDIGPDSS